MRDNIEIYPSPSGMIWKGRPSNMTKSGNDVLAFFNDPLDSKHSDCIIEVWKKVSKRFAGITFKDEIKVVGIFRVKKKIK